MKMDPEFQDTILHRAGHILYEIVDRAVAEARDVVLKRDGGERTADF